MKAVIDLVALLAILCAFWRLAVYTARWFFGMVASRFDAPPAPVGVHEMAVEHPERCQIDLSDHERDVLMVLDALTKWETA